MKDKIKDNASVMLFASVCLIIFIINFDNFVSFVFRQGEEIVVMQEPVISMDKFWYAHAMGLRMRIVIDGEERIGHGSSIARGYIDPIFPTFNPFFDELIFVHSEEEARNFPDNVIVAWPREEGRWTEGLIYGIHWAMSVPRDPSLHEQFGFTYPITFEQFGLTYPITTTDLIDSWEGVNTMWNWFSDSTQSTIRSLAPMGIPDDADSSIDN